MPSRKDIKVKVCGITTIADAHLVAEAGADYIGIVVEINFSPRRVSVEQAGQICAQATLPVVPLFFNWDAAQIQNAVATLHPHAVQLLGQESPALVKTLKGTVDCQLWKSIHLPPQDSAEVDITEYQDKINSLIDSGIDAILLDTVTGSPQEKRRYGGTGQVSNWDTARRLVEVIPVCTFLAGGINPQNVRMAIETVRPHGIDLCSGTESTPGHKDPEKLRQLMLAIRGAVPINR